MLKTVSISALTGCLFLANDLSTLKRDSPYSPSSKWAATSSLFKLISQIQNNN
ncbi:hypothetical protein O9929_15645 [Vibrio lentus]|nr:hypothetical protein [Vibrio lentus]